MQTANKQALDFLDLLKAERKDSAKERRDLQKNFLDAVQAQTDQQNHAMKNLGDRVERQMEGMRSDMRSATNRMTWTLVIALLIVASLSGVAVKFRDIELTPHSDLVDPPPSAQNDHK